MHTILLTKMKGEADNSIRPMLESQEDRRYKLLCCLLTKPPAKPLSSLGEAEQSRLIPPPRPAHAPTWNSTALLLARSALLPASAMTMLGLACLCNSFTQFLARANVSWEDRARLSNG